MKISKEPAPFTYGLDITWLAAREEQLVDEHLVSLGRRTALERTAYLPLHLFVRAEEAGLVKNGIIQFPFMQQHLADTFDMSLVHTRRSGVYSSAKRSLERPHI